MPTYTIDPDYNDDGNGPREVWVTTSDYYAGDGTLYEAGTILKDAYLADLAAASPAAQLGLIDESTLEGFTNAWFTTQDREPFEPVLNDDGTEYITGPRWRLQPDKYGQDLPSVVIPTDPSDPPPTTQSEVKYDVGAETQTVLNLLDWATDISPLSISAGWQNNAGEVSVNGLNLTENFDVSVYIKGDVKPATVYSAELLLDYEEITLHAAGATIDGTAESDYLVGIGSNTFTGFGGSDLFVLSYGTSVTDVVTSSVITDFEVGSDKIGLIGFDALAGFDAEDPNSAALITQAVSGDDVTVSVDGELVATLQGLADDLDTDGNGAIDPGDGLSLLDSFFVSNPTPASAPPPPINQVVGTPGDDTLVGTIGEDILSGLAGNDILYGLSGNDTLDGGADNDTLVGGEGDDRLYGRTGENLFFGGSGNDLYWLENGSDRIADGGDGFDRSYFLASGTTLSIDATWAGLERVDVMGADATVDATGYGESILLAGRENDDNLVGGDGNDSVYGGLGDDTLKGGSGVDFLYGNEGSNVFDGGEGDDFFWIASTTDRVTDSGSSTDRGYVLTAGDSLIVDANWSGIERLDLRALNAGIDATGYAADLLLAGDLTNDILTGGEGDDQLFGLDGNDTLSGGAGNDRLKGGAGENLFLGGSGDDLYWLESGSDRIADGGDGFDRAYFLATGTTLSIDATWAGLERVDVMGADATVDATGYGESILLAGRENDDNLIGGEGDDRLYGGVGSDTLRGGAGQDRLFGDAGADVFHFSDSTAADYVIGWEDGIDLIDASSVGGFAALTVNVVGAHTQIAAASGEALLIADWLNGIDGNIDASDFV